MSSTASSLFGDPTPGSRLSTPSSIRMRGTTTTSSSSASSSSSSTSATSGSGSTEKGSAYDIFTSRFRAPSLSLSSSTTISREPPSAPAGSTGATSTPVRESGNPLALARLRQSSLSSRLESRLETKSEIKLPESPGMATEASGELRRLREAREKAEAERIEQEAAAAALAAELEGLGAEVGVLEMENADAEFSLAQMREQIESCRTRKTKLETDKAALQAKLEEVMRAGGEGTGRIEAMEREVAELEDACDQLAVQLEVKAASAVSAQSQAHDLEASLGVWREKEKVLRENHARAEAEMSALNAQVDALRREVSAAERDAAAESALVGDEKRRRDQERAVLEDARDALTEQLAVLEAARNDAQRKAAVERRGGDGIETLRRDVRSLQAKRDALRAEVEETTSAATARAREIEAKNTELQQTKRVLKGEIRSLRAEYTRQLNTLAHDVSAAREKTLALENEKRSLLSSLVTLREELEARVVEVRAVLEEEVGRHGALESTNARLAQQLWVPEINNGNAVHEPSENFIGDIPEVRMSDKVGKMMETEAHNASFALSLRQLEDMEAAREGLFAVLGDRGIHSDHDNLRDTLRA